mgnify:FL=1
MLGIRTPFRVSFAGGSTDLPAFYEKNGGKVLSTSIDKYMYHFIHKFDDSKIQVKYSKTELVNSPQEIKHPIVFEASKIFDMKGLDINSISDVPKGTGLGSSSAYTVGLIHGLTIHNKKKISRNKLAAISADLEINKLKDPIGKQDHYASTFGGLNVITFYKNGSVKVKKMEIEKEVLRNINSSMILLKFGNSRSASKILKDQNKNLKKDKYINLTKEIYNLVEDMEKSFINNDVKSIGEILTENWEIKSKLSDSISSTGLDKEMNEIRKINGVYGGKLLGAGKSGYILIAGKPKVINRLKQNQNLDFNFDNSGSSVILNNTV